jgi:flagellar biogenesis protein FliO
MLKSPKKTIKSLWLSSVLVLMGSMVIGMTPQLSQAQTRDFDHLEVLPQADGDQVVFHFDPKSKGPLPEYRIGYDETLLKLSFKKSRINYPAEREAVQGNVIKEVEVLSGGSQVVVNMWFKQPLRQIIADMTVDLDETQSIIKLFFPDPLKLAKASAALSEKAELADKEASALPQPVKSSDASSKASRAGRGMTEIVPLTTKPASEGVKFVAPENNNEEVALAEDKNEEKKEEVKEKARPKNGANSKPVLLADQNSLLKELLEDAGRDTKDSQNEINGESRNSASPNSWLAASAVSKSSLELFGLIGGLCLVGLSLKFWLQKRQGGGNKIPIKQLGSCSIGFRWNISLVEIPGAILVLGTGEKGVSLLTEIRDARIIEQIKQQSGNNEKGFEEYLRQFNLPLKKARSEDFAGPESSNVAPMEPALKRPVAAHGPANHPAQTNNGPYRTHNGANRPRNVPAQMRNLQAAMQAYGNNGANNNTTNRESAHR